MLEIVDTGGTRFELAMERLQAGHAIRFRDVTFFVGTDSHLEISINSSCAPENVTEQTALEELARAQNTYRSLCADSVAFETAFGRRTPRFILSYDYGTGSVELARLIDRTVVWAKGFAPALS